MCLLKSLDSKHRTASVGAFVATTNSSLTKFYSRVIYQRTSQELMDGLAVCLKGIFIQQEISFIFEFVLQTH